MNQNITLPQLGLPEGMIHLGIGQPSPTLLPVQFLNEAASGILSGNSTDFLAYGNARGNPGFREILAGFLSQGTPGEPPVDPCGLFITNGNSQALDLVSTLFAKPGDTVFIEEPSYFLALDIFRDHGLNL
ncbi:MAG: aminotransferase class I/II-fold pyridoxal phosphate-dependent enzyme, partial [Desulfobacterales bacterium]|nr:aminotransferase class I/II-fold pyridoxal phosphate-dependent enzyme [Desulfobacterales bacterium]